MTAAFKGRIALSAFLARRRVISATPSTVASVSTSVAGRSSSANAARRNSIASASAARSACLRPSLRRLLARLLRAAPDSADAMGFVNRLAFYALPP